MKKMLLFRLSDKKGERFMKIILFGALLALQPIVNAEENAQSKPSGNRFSEWLSNTFGLGKKTEEQYFSDIEPRPYSIKEDINGLVYLDKDGNRISASDYFTNNSGTPINITTVRNGTNEPDLYIEVAGKPKPTYYNSPGYTVVVDDPKDIKKVRVLKRRYENLGDSGSKLIPEEEVEIDDLKPKIREKIEVILDKQNDSNPSCDL